MMGATVARVVRGKLGRFSSCFCASFRGFFPTLMNRIRWTAFAAVAVLGFCVACGGGSDEGRAQDTEHAVLPDGTLATATALPYIPPPSEVPEGLDIVWEAYSLLVREYVDRDKIDPDELSEGAVLGMLEALDDRYTSYISPETFRLEQEGFEGKFEGIGATVEQTADGKRIVIVAPLPDTPAERAGIKAGDIILAVDGEDTEDWSVLDAVSRIRGPKGTTVELLIQHLGEPEPVVIAVVRGTIPLVSLQGRMLQDNPYGLIHINTFTAETPRELREALADLVEQGAKGIILDVRRNPGGLLGATVDVASEFLTDGLVTYEIDSRGARDDWRVRSGGRHPDIPLVLLVDGFSASGSEVLAGALQDHGRALIIGTETFGKGSVNLLRELSNEGGLYLTVAHWYTPNGRLIEEQGVVPDVIVEFERASQKDFDFEDPQLAAAIEQLDFQTGAAALP